ncbi:unnamed protein product [Lactuca saligna]|uniref:DNA mismatch repair proteins mutS family domain-containing protein n=1 Tax=Lactuca saligna TaxID=75948 RepID=A0AA35UY45_LACSI|nr:unnamed protein product [Lactuca saligna]
MPAPCPTRGASEAPERATSPSHPTSFIAVEASKLRCVSRLLSDTIPFAPSHMMPHGAEPMESTIGYHSSQSKVWQNNYIRSSSSKGQFWGFKTIGLKLEAEDQKSKVEVYYHIVKLLTNTTVSIEVNNDFSSNENTITIGSQHALGPLTTVKARLLFGFNYASCFLMFCLRYYTNRNLKMALIMPLMIQFADPTVDLNMQLFIVLTGPNMGGKSTLMRQLCLALILAQVGADVPAQSFKMLLVDRIFLRIGAKYHIMTGHSTFLTELLETASMLSSATCRSVMALDELIQGTSTSNGQAIAASVLEHLVNKIQFRGFPDAVLKKAAIKSQEFETMYGKRKRTKQSNFKICRFYLASTWLIGYHKSLTRPPNQIALVGEVLPLGDKSSKNSTIIHEDIDRIIAKGEEATAELDAMMKKFTEDAIKFKMDDSMYI